MAFSFRIIKNALKKLLKVPKFMRRSSGPILPPELIKESSGPTLSPDLIKESSGPTLPPELIKESSGPTLPPELIIDILSRLPIEHLAHVQLVSKQWQALTQDRFLIKKHMAQSPVHSYWCNGNIPAAAGVKKDGYNFMHGCDGVTLLLNLTSNKFVLWNPAISRVLDLPEPRPGTIRLVMMYVPATLDYRIVSVYINESGLGCEVLTPGPSMTWKTLPFPDVPNPDKVLVVPIGSDVHCALVTKSGVETTVVTLDVVAESFSTVSRRHVSCDDVAVNWEGKLGFVNVVGKSLEVVRLEDCKEEKTIIPLPFVGKPGFKEGSVIRLAFCRGGKFWFWLGGKKVCSYTIESGETVCVAESKAMANYESGVIYTYKRSLLRFEGMRSDGDTHLASLVPM